MIHYRYPITMEIAGATALLVETDCGDAPVSYAAPTPSAVRGFLNQFCGA